MNGIVERIIFLTQRPLSLRDYKRFGIELLRNNGFSVEIWDISHILYPKIFNNSKTLNNAGLVVFEKKKEACLRLSKLQHRDLVVTALSYNFESLWAYRALSSGRARYALRYVNILPVSDTKEDFLRLSLRMIKKIASFRKLHAWKNLLMKVHFKYLGVRPADIILCGGDRWRSHMHHHRFPIDDNTEILWVHTLDYDLYLGEKTKPCTEDKIVVFLDEFVPYHPDHIFINGKESNVDARRYYSLLNSFFDTVEEKTGMKVIIACHPRSDYDNLPDCFEGRKRIKGRTIDLIRKSNLVLSHCSTALTFANLFYKPVIFMTCSELDKIHKYKNHNVRHLADRFGKVPISLDDNNGIDLAKESMVNKSNYDNYRRGYIKTEHSKELPVWQIFADNLKSRN